MSKRTSFELKVPLRTDQLIRDAAEREIAHQAEPERAEWEELEARSAPRRKDSQ